jgi:3-hydroxymyristoyl/3-hydroxydecanoyl-(acyl carrier protein) dehydratase
MGFRVRRAIPADHPSLAGHFPGRPVVPAVVILDEVVASIREWRGECRVTGIPFVKFVSPLGPGRDLDIRLRNEGGDLIAFECSSHGEAVAAGRMVVAPGR